MKWHMTQLGSRENYLYPRIIKKSNMLGSFSTDIWLPFAQKIKLRGSLYRMKSRFNYSFQNTPVDARNFYSIYRMIHNYKGNRFDQWCSQGREYGDWFVKNIQAANPEIGDKVFGYTCATNEIAKYAKKNNMKVVMGQFDPGLYWYKTRYEEAQNWKGAENNIIMPSEEYMERLTQEWDLSDYIIVNSMHSQKAVSSYGIDSNKIKIIPLCVNIDQKLDIEYRKISNKLKFRILFVLIGCVATTERSTISFTL